ncbi:medium-chain fatty-acid--CoA ligase-like [Mytilus californianus]|uniref:medium-chain fatty-acid--CoA ligase-like n=1 Tax=Mytilus californianus TaxID=6549 RepID=UPI0022457964|nr:medium-chain fatty-acid--CoA ligase-like [Mytilus californianus]
MLRDNAKIFPDREAIVFLSTTGERTFIKYQELYDQAKFFAKGLLETGIKRNDVVAISNKNCVKWVISSLGVQMTERGRISIITLPLISPDDIAAIFLTSGSTGIPKAVPQTHLSLVRNLHVIGTGGSPVESSCTSAAGVIANKVVVMYGTTEFGLASAIQVSNPKEFEDYAIGYPTPGVELKIVDDDGNIVPKGTSGELYFRSRDRFHGYLNNKEKSALCSDKAGWYKTDDIGVMRENGIFIVKGRKSDMMIIGGLLVTHLYVENIIKKHPNVIDAYVYPVHDDKMFQRVYAAVVVQPEGALSDEAIRNYIVQQQSGNLDSFLEKLYIPEHFFFYKELPHTRNGKLDQKATALMIKSTKESKSN